MAIPFILGSIPDSRSIIGLVLLGVFQTGFCIILYALAMKHIKAIEAALITVIEPLLNPMWVFIFREKPGLYAIIGGIIVLSSVTIRKYVSRKPEKV